MDTIQVQVHVCKWLIHRVLVSMHVRSVQQNRFISQPSNLDIKGKQIFKKKRGGYLVYWRDHDGISVIKKKIIRTKNKCLTQQFSDILIFTDFRTIDQASRNKPVTSVPVSILISIRHNITGKPAIWDFLVSKYSQNKHVFIRVR